MCSSDTIDSRRQRVPYKKSSCNNHCCNKIKPGEINLTTIKKTVQGQIQELFNDHGFINYKLDQELLESTLTKNGALPLPNNDGKIFFHRNEVSGGIKSLSLGQVVAFELVHLKSNNRIIALRVNFSDNNTDDDDGGDDNRKTVSYQQSQYAKTALSHFQFIKPIEFKRIDDTQHPIFKRIATNIKGVVRKLVPDQTCGFLSINNQKTHIFFSGKDMYELRFRNLKEGQKVCFNLYQNARNRKYVAREVTKVEDDQLSLAKKILAGSSLSVQSKTSNRFSRGDAAKNLIPKLPSKSLMNNTREKWETRNRSVKTLCMRSKSQTGSR